MYKYTTVLNSKVVSFKNDNLNVLLGIVTDHFSKLNINYNSEDIKRQIERQSKKKDDKSKKISIAKAFNGAKAILRMTAGNSCSSEEMIRRSNICESCPLSNTTSRCAACGASKKIALLVNSLQQLKKVSRAIPVEVKSKFCDICGCSLAVMVTTKYVDFYEEPKDKNIKRPDACWLKRSSVNFTKE